MERKKSILSLTATKRILLILFTSAVLLTTGMGSVFASPLVIKGGDEQADELGQESEQQEISRDRSLQDGTLIYSMTPVYPEDVKEGSYKVDVISSSRFFKITDAELTNKGGEMTAVITLSSTSYAYVYPGSAAEAASAPESEWTAADESTGFGRFTVEVPALNSEMPCAAYSKAKQKWYDRDIVFLASGLPEDAVLVEMSGDGGTIVDTQEAAVKVIYIALAIIVIGGVINHFVKKRFYE